MDVELSIIMPCLNDAQTLASCIRTAHRYVQCSGVSGEVVVSDNGSSDGFQEIPKGLGARVVDIPIRGLHAAFGIGGPIVAVSHWASESFGALDPDRMLRIVMPAVFAVALGVQIVCSSFFLSILGLRRRR